MFINDAFAATAATADVGALGGTLIQLALILLIFYLFLIRPQQKKMRAHAAMVEALKVGDRVLLSSGIYGTISKIKDDKISLEIAPDVVIVIDHMTVGAVVSEDKKDIVSVSKTKVTKTNNKIKGKKNV